MMRLMDLDIDSEYPWDGTDGYGIKLGEPCNVTVVSIDRSCTMEVVILTPDDRHWGVRAKTLSPAQG
jgi:hypothetical protein